MYLIVPKFLVIGCFIFVLRFGLYMKFHNDSIIEVHRIFWFTFIYSRISL